jgi:hypothetical protein
VARPVEHPLGARRLFVDAGLPSHAPVSTGKGRTSESGGDPSAVPAGAATRGVSRADFASGRVVALTPRSGRCCPGLVESEVAAEPAWCGAGGASDAEADLADGRRGDRVGRVVHPVDMADGGAGQVEAGHGDAGGGALGQVGTQGGRLGRPGAGSGRAWCTSGPTDPRGRRRRVGWTRCVRRRSPRRSARRQHRSAPASASLSPGGGVPLSPAGAPAGRTAGRRGGTGSGAGLAADTVFGSVAFGDVVMSAM